MCLFGSTGSNGTGNATPVVSSVQASAPSSVQANKDLDQEAANQKAILAANTNGANNVLNGGEGIIEDAEGEDARLSTLG